MAFLYSRWNPERTASATNKASTPKPIPKTAKMETTVNKRRCRRKEIRRDPKSLPKAIVLFISQDLHNLAFGGLPGRIKDRQQAHQGSKSRNQQHMPKIQIHREDLHIIRRRQ